MKIINIFKIGSPLLIGAALFVSSCNSNEDGISLMEAARSARFINDTHVTFQHVQTLVGAMRPQTRAASSEEYVFITGNDGDTLFFVVNYPEGGWTMYASDMRVPAVVAECEKGKFVLDEAVDAFGAWLEDMKDDMKAVRKSRDEELNFTTEEMNANIEYWLSVCAPDVCINLYNSKQTRGGEPLDPIILPSGHYELDTTYTYLTSYDSLDHLTSTTWHQVEPYNYYCPLKTDGSGKKAPAGCVAIAGAQMIYFLHYKLGVPEYIPDSAYCTGNINSYSWGQYTLNRNVWMRTFNNGNPGHYTLDFNGNWVEEGTLYAPLIANIGFLVDMDYGNNGSSAETEDLVDAFNYYGISCQYVDFDEGLLHTSLNNGMPVVARAKYNVLHGHAFIIDGYKRKAMQTTYVYRWVSDMPSLPLNPGGPFTPGIEPGGGEAPADSIVHTYSMISLSHIKMNWGWGEYELEGQPGVYANNIWFTPTGDWIIESHNYNGNRKMIYNFAVIEN